MASGENLVVLRFRTEADGAIVGIEKVGAASGATAEKIKLSNDAIEESNVKSVASFAAVRDMAAEASEAAMGGMKGMVAGIAAYVGYEGIRSMVKSSMAWQQQTATLGRSLSNAGIQSKGLASHLGDVTEKLSTKGGFAAPDQMTGMAQFITQTGSVRKALKMNTATMDLARLTNNSYAGSMRLVQTAMAGTPGRLSRIVGTIIPVTKYTVGLTSAWEQAHPVQYRHLQMLDKQATAQEIYTKIMAKAGGQMQTYSKTTTGAMSNAKNAIDNAGRQIGTVLLPYVAKAAQWLGKNLPTALTWLVGAVKNANQWIKNASTNIATFISRNATAQRVIHLTANGFVELWGVAKKVAVFVAGDLARSFDTIKSNILGVVSVLTSAFNALKAVYDLAKSAANFVFGSGSPKQNRQQRANAVSPSGGRFGPVTPGYHPGAPSAVHKQIKSLSAIGTGKTDANGQSTSAPTSGGANPQIIELHHVTKIGSRAVANEVARYALRQNALSGAFTAVV